MHPDKQYSDQCDLRASVSQQIHILQRQITLGTELSIIASCERGR